jgi:asparagine synthase (glutamine-hydrolysing)
MSLILKNASIINYLTLRYDPIKDSHDSLKYENFKEKEIKDVQLEIIDIVKRDLDFKISQKKISNISIALSGGIDSGFTLAMIRKFFPDLRIDSICVGFGDDDDEIYRAREIAEKHDSHFHELIIDNVLEDLPRLISITGVPKWNLYQYYPLEKAKSFSDVFFSGDGGDEMFGGYVFRYKKFLDRLYGLDNPNWLDKSRIYLECHERDWVPDQNKIFNKKLNFSWLKIYENFRPYFENYLYPLDQVFLSDFNGKLLQDWIPSNHEFGKYLELNIYSLFLNPEMISLSTRLHWEVKYDYEKDIGKLPLLSILNNYLGFNNFHNVKKGFSLNLINLWKNYGKETILHYLHKDSDVVKNNIINIEWIIKAIRLVDESLNYNMRIRYISKLLGVLSLEIWYQLFVSDKLKPSSKLM